MPRVSQFFGVVIYMYHNDHAPPHFHAEYGDAEAVFAIDTLDILRGRLPRRASNMVVEWALEHRPELRSNWDRVRESMTLEPIEPLE